MTVDPNTYPDPSAAIKSRRAELELSRAKFARLCRLDPATVQALELKPNSKPDWSTICKLVRYAGMDPRILVGEPGAVDLEAVGLAA